MAKNSGPVRTVHARTTGKERDEMIATTKAEIEKKFGQGSITVSYTHLTLPTIA